jgi:photosystem II stability/assembly factor-like uncharacterized protein
MKIRMNASRLILAAALSAATLCQSCVGDVATPEQEPGEWIDIPVPPVVVTGVNSIASDRRGTLFIGMDREVALWRSVDGGSTWIQKTFGLNTRFAVEALLVKDGSTVFAALRGGGVFVSRNRGESWKQMNNHLTDIDAISLAAAPGGGVLVGTTNGKIFRSENDGGVWVETETDPIRGQVSDFAVDQSGDVYAACGWYGIFFSADSGRTWAPSSAGLENLLITSLAVREGGGVLAGTWGAGLYISTGAGGPWLRIDDGTLSNSAIEAIAEDRSGGLLVGTSARAVLRSSDGGYSWEEWNIGLQGLYVTSLLPVGNAMLAGTSNCGVFLSIDAGNTWNPPRSYVSDDTSPDVFSQNAYSLLTDSCGTYYVQNLTSVYRSRDGGESWVRACGGVSSYIHDIAIHPDSYLLTATDYGVYISYDSGDSWSPADTSSADLFQVAALAVTPNGTVFGWTDGSIVRFSDGCSSSERVLDGVDVTALSTGARGCIYVGTYYGGVIGSSDGGDTWNRMTDSLKVYGIEADLVGNVCVTSRKGVLCSADGGVTWSTLPFGTYSGGGPVVAVGTFYYSMAAAPGGEMAFIFDNEGTLYVSEDCFASWRTIPVPFGDAVLSLGPDGRLYLSERYRPALHASRYPFLPAHSG